MITSFVGSLNKAILGPAQSVIVSVSVSATTSAPIAAAALFADRANVLNEFSLASPLPPPPAASHVTLPEPSVVSCSPLEPSAIGRE